ncbi:malonyl CoA-acyl carrier protein transacylase [Halobacteroides halobius DSM 5150]|uniref:Malonyl CoA-acyl carrier protein transacylase n=1 Tax=Halobacteroides halobius (strain ATCC 35273 / DSM 5150 / MD-1) TaxID=748449 RepID=L0KAH9_HALHC|nr:ACP S-malonyltransferase [Halobacteroides halobius]AGB41364.1 malonyl CoA-acyl carrier protein transacylase [Halobacteroides halobius DSM 5150]
MSKIAFIFPGQGSQHVGMGQDLAEEFPVVKETFKEANQALDIDITKLCFTGPEDKLKETANTQPAILATSIAVYRLLLEKGIEPEVVAGHSLGEYSALVAAGVIDFATGLQLVRKRGQLMSQADPSGEGAMAAIIGLEPQEVKEVCQQGSEKGIVEVANYNCPGQVVISGQKKAVTNTAELAQEAGAKKAITLNVSGPFHSSLMESAGKKLADYLEQIEFNEADLPLVPNVKADFTTQPAEIKEALIKQISGSVRWEESIKQMINEDLDTFIEVGPGRVLKGFMRRIDRSVTALNVGSMRSLKKTLKKL